MKRTLLLAALLLIAGVAHGQCLANFQTEAISAFYVGEPGNFQIIADSGNPPYKFEIVEGSLPEGLHLTPSGRIVGVPEAEGYTVATIRLTDADGCVTHRAYEVYVLSPTAG